jgi:hypothetical protein
MADDYIVGSAEDAGSRPICLVIMLPDAELARPERAHLPPRSAITSNCAAIANGACCAPRGGVDAWRC